MNEGILVHAFLNYILLFTQKTSNLIKFKQLVTSICLNAYEQNSVEYMY